MSPLQEVLRRLKRAAGVMFSLFAIVIVGITIFVCFGWMIIWYQFKDVQPLPRHNSRAWR